MPNQTDYAIDLATELAKILAQRIDAHAILEELWPLLKELRFPNTQQRMARLADVSQASISKVENGILERMDDKLLLRIMRAYIELG